MSKVRHVLGISGGKDSAALAIYIKDNDPEIHEIRVDAGAAANTGFRA